MIFIILLFIKIVSFPLFYFIFIFIYLFICALKKWEDFKLIYKGFKCKVGLGQLNQVNLHLARYEFKRRPTQLNLIPTRARNQRKFAPNPSPIRIRILDYTLVGIFGITLGSDVQLRWFKLGWKVNFKGYNFLVTKSPNSEAKWAKTVVKWSLKIWDFLQMGIGFLDLFKGSLGKKKERRENLRGKGGATFEESSLESFWGQRDAASCWSTNSRWKT